MIKEWTNRIEGSIENRQLESESWRKNLSNSENDPIKQIRRLVNIVMEMGKDIKDVTEIKELENEQDINFDDELVRNFIKKIKFIKIDELEKYICNNNNNLDTFLNAIDLPPQNFKIVLQKEIMKW